MKAFARIFVDLCIAVLLALFVLSLLYCTLRWTGQSDRHSYRPNPLVESFVHQSF